MKLFFAELKQVYYSFCLYSIRAKQHKLLQKHTSLAKKHNELAAKVVRTNRPGKVRTWLQKYYNRKFKRCYLDVLGTLRSITEPEKLEPDELGIIRYDDGKTTKCITTEMLAVWEEQEKTKQTESESDVGTNTYENDKS